MKPIAGNDGLYEIEDEMPCQPSQIGVGMYFLPSTLGRAEREEAAARVLTFSKQMNVWVGVSWSRLATMMQEDLEKIIAANKLREQETRAHWAYQAATRRYKKFATFTLGISTLFMEKPAPSQKNNDGDERLPFTIMSVFGPQAVINGVHELIADEMLKKVDVGEGDNAFSVFFPTSKLISRIMAVQKVQPA